MKMTRRDMYAIEVQDIKITGYYKYSFDIEAKTKDGKIIKVYCGGDKDDIYRFEPFGGWGEWFGASHSCDEYMTISIDGEEIEIIKQCCICEKEEVEIENQICDICNEEYK